MMSRFFARPAQINDFIHQGLNDEQSSSALFVRRREFNSGRQIKSTGMIDHLEFEPGLITLNLNFDRLQGAFTARILYGVVASLDESKLAACQDFCGQPVVRKNAMDGARTFSHGAQMANHAKPESVISPRGGLSPRERHLDAGNGRPWAGRTMCQTAAVRLLFEVHAMM
jgi:hypothetical protein